LFICLFSEISAEFTNCFFSVILIYTNVGKRLRAGIVEDAVRLMNEKGSWKVAYERCCQIRRQKISVRFCR